MELSKVYTCDKNELPLERLVEDGGFCKIFRTIACVGDSLSSGEFESLDAEGNKGYHDMYEYSWGQFIARTCGSYVYNFSRGGMTAQEYTDTFAEAKGFWDEDKKAQAYIIAMGVNDISSWRKDIAAGEISDIDLSNYNNNARTFVGFYGKIIQRYKEIQPKAKFFLVTRPVANDNSEFDNNAKKTNELIRQIAEIFDNTYLIDMEKYAPKYDSEFGKLFFLGGHMNAMGYIITAKMFMSYIDYIIRHNMEDFMQVPFIGKPNDLHNVNYKW